MATKNNNNKKKIEKKEQQQQQEKEAIIRWTFKISQIVINSTNTIKISPIHTKNSIHKLFIDFHKYVCMCVQVFMVDLFFSSKMTRTEQNRKEEGKFLMK